MPLTFRRILHIEDVHYAVLGEDFAVTANLVADMRERHLSDGGSCSRDQATVPSVFSHALPGFVRPFLCSFAFIYDHAFTYTVSHIAS